MMKFSIMSRRFSGLQVPIRSVSRSILPVSSSLRRFQFWKYSYLLPSAPILASIPFARITSSLW